MACWRLASSLSPTKLLSRICREDVHLGDLFGEFAIAHILFLPASRHLHRGSVFKANDAGGDEGAGAWVRLEWCLQQTRLQAVAGADCEALVQALTARSGIRSQCKESS